MRHLNSTRAVSNEAVRRRRAARAARVSNAPPLQGDRSNGELMRAKLSLATLAMVLVATACGGGSSSSSSRAKPTDTTAKPAVNPADQALANQAVLTLSDLPQDGHRSRMKTPTARSRTRSWLS